MPDNRRLLEFLQSLMGGGFGTNSLGGLGIPGLGGPGGGGAPGGGGVQGGFNPFPEVPPGGNLPANFNTLAPRPPGDSAPGLRPDIFVPAPQRPGSNIGLMAGRGLGRGNTLGGFGGALV